LCAYELHSSRLTSRKTLRYCYLRSNVTVALGSDMLFTCCYNVTTRSTFYAPYKSAATQQNIPYSMLVLGEQIAQEMFPLLPIKDLETCYEIIDSDCQLNHEVCHLVYMCYTDNVEVYEYSVSNF
jgi:hypothetical protein